MTVAAHRDNLEESWNLLVVKGGYPVSCSVDVLTESYGDVVSCVDLQS